MYAFVSHGLSALHLNLLLPGRRLAASPRETPTYTHYASGALVLAASISIKTQPNAEGGRRADVLRVGQVLGNGAVLPVVVSGRIVQNSQRYKWHSPRVT